MEDRQDPDEGRIPQTKQQDEALDCVRHVLAFGQGKQSILQKKADGVPSKYLKLDFDTKFEIERAPHQKKDEEDDTLGAITGLTLMREVNETYPLYKLTSSVKQILAWRSFLIPRVNQWQFHHMFRVFKKIGKGNFASVYLAERIEDEENMAIKAFSKSVAYAEENGKEAILNELKVMRKLANRHLMRMFEVYETSNSLYVALELLNGGSLYELVKDKQQLTLQQIATILVGILQGLNHMHSKEIMHRDLKLENILFKQSKKLETVVIADFGLATYVNEPVYLYCRCGTPGYVAPEVINVKDMKSHYSSVCDIYSLGLVFYLLISGKPAFPGKSYSTVVKQNREATVDFTLKQLQAAPGAAIDLLKAMLEKDPKKRVTAAQCLEHPFLKDIARRMQEDEKDDNDYVNEPEENSNVSDRMNQLNEEQYSIQISSQRFEMTRKNNLLNSPCQSPGISTKIKNQKHIDSQNMVGGGNSPLFNGKTDSVDSIQNIGSPALKPNQFGASPNLKPSKFKSNAPDIQLGKAALSKYGQRKE